MRHVLDMLYSSVVCVTLLCILLFLHRAIITYLTIQLLAFVMVTRTLVIIHVPRIALGEPAIVVYNLK